MRGKHIQVQSTSPKYPIVEEVLLTNSKLTLEML